KLQRTGEGDLVPLESTDRLVGEVRREFFPFIEEATVGRLSQFDVGGLQEKLPDRFLQRGDLGLVVLSGNVDVVLTEPLDRLHEPLTDPIHLLSGETG